MALFLLFTTMVLTCCKENEQSVENTVIFTGIKDVKISVSDTEYDFLAGVTAQDENGLPLEVQADASKVTLGTAGKYEVVYKTSKGEQSVDVYIYGEPTITTETLTLTYKDVATGGSMVADKIEAKDTFGGSVDVRVAIDLLDANGSVKTGAGQITAYATDIFGNEAQKTISVMVQAPEKEYSFKEQNIDFAKAYATFEIGESTLLSVYVNQNDQGASSFACQNGYFMLLPSLFGSLGTGEHTLTLNFNDGVGKMLCMVTDDEALQIVEDFSIEDEVFVVGDTILLPTVARAEYSVQDFTVNCYLQVSGAEREAVSRQERVLTEKGSYTYIAEVLQDDRVIETRAQNFTVLSVQEAFAENLVTERYFPYVSSQSCATKYEENVTVNGVKTNAFHAQTTSNVQTDSGFWNFLLIDSTLVQNAMREGYTRVYMRLYTANGIALYGGRGSSAVFWNKEKTEPREIASAWDIANFAGGILIDVFGGTPADVYLTELRFTGLKPDFSTNIVSRNVLSWVTNNSCSVSYEMNATVNGATTNAFHVYRESVQSESTFSNYVKLDASLISMAKAEGYTTITFTLYTANGLAIYNGTSNLVKYKSQASAPRELTQTLELVSFANGLLFDVFGGEALDVYITSITFGK
ncbi:MAG: hypothetical protein IJX91_05385 [Clostridia bacterium]|nr:hypothetical protein [Clostridia bacterium]